MKKWSVYILYTTYNILFKVESLKNKEAEAEDKIKEFNNNVEQLNDKLDAENILSKEKDEKIKDLETTIAEIKERHEEGLKAAEDTREQLVQAQSAVVLLEAKLKGLTKVSASFSQNLLK